MYVYRPRVCLTYRHVHIYLLYTYIHYLYVRRHNYCSMYTILVGLYNYIPSKTWRKRWSQVPEPSKPELYSVHKLCSIRLPALRVHGLRHAVYQASSANPSRAHLRTPTPTNCCGLSRRIEDQVFVVHCLGFELKGSGLREFGCCLYKYCI